MGSYEQPTTCADRSEAKRFSHRERKGRVCGVETTRRSEVGDDALRVLLEIGNELNMPQMPEHPFEYPAGVHVRRHGPSGWTEYQRYRSWLRDEFCFRCVYCLLREQWLDMRRGLQV